MSPREGRGGGEGHKCKKSTLEIGKKSKPTIPSNNSGENLLTDNTLFIIFNFVNKESVGTVTLFQTTSNKIKFNKKNPLPLVLCSDSLTWFSIY